MAIYELVTDVVMLPYHYLASTGLEASHDTTDDKKAVDERGNPKSANAAIYKRDGRLIYQNAEDYNLLSDEEKANAFHNTDEAALNRMLHFGAIQEVDKTPQAQHSTEEEQQSTEEQQEEKPKRGKK